MKRSRVIMNVIIASLMGIALSLLIKAIYANHDIQSNTVYVAELSEEILPGQRITAESLIEGMEMITPGTVQVINSDQALNSMKDDMPELAYLSENPFRDIITFQAKGMKENDMHRLKDAIKEIEGVEEVYVDKSLHQWIDSSLQKPRWGLILISLIIALGALMALCLRIHRDLREYNEEMKILSLSGATNESISNKRLGWSVKWGTVSAVLAALVTVLNIYGINQTLLHGMEISLTQGIIAVASMIALVIIAHAVITYFTIKSYLSKLNPSISS